MDAIEEKLGAVLNNPQLMQQIMSMAQTMSQSQPPQEEAPSPAPMPEMDAQSIQNLMRLASQAGIDRKQKTLLAALQPYLTPQRLQKLEKAMRASRLASLASSALGNGTLLSIIGR